MVLHKKLFTEIIDAMRDQQDLETEKAARLSSIYGSDIDPANNQLLVNALFAVFGEAFNEEGVDDIQHFCFEQDFGRKVNSDSGILWESLLRDFDVEFEEVG